MALKQKPKNNGETNMNLFKSVGISVGLFLAVIFCLLTFRFINVAPTDVAVVVDKFGHKVDPMPLGVGYQFYNGWSTDMVTYHIAARSFPKDSMSTDNSANEYNMSLKTIDGQGVKVDMTIIYSLNAKDVPALHSVVGPDYEDQILLPQVRSEARIAIGSYTSEQMYDGKVREQIQAAIKQKLVAALAKYPAINIQDVLMRDFAWENPDYQHLIEQKKIAAQQVEVNKNLVAASLEMAQKQQADAEGNKLQAVQEAEGKGESLKAVAEGNAASIKINADAERYKLEQEAAGNLARYKAEAEGKKLAAEALGGGQYVVALKFAESLSPDLKVVAYPTGAPGTTSLMDLTGVFGQMFKKQEAQQ